MSAVTRSSVGDIVSPNAACAVALVDRLTHHAEILSIDGGGGAGTEAEARAQAEPVITRAPLSSTSVHMYAELHERRQEGQVDEVRCWQPEAGSCKLI